MTYYASLSGFSGEDGELTMRVEFKGVGAMLAVAGNVLDKKPKAEPR